MNFIRTRADRFLIATALAGSMGWTSAATAQNAAPPPAATVDNRVVGANDIIVTATRRTERLENVPASILAVTGTALEKAGVTKFQDLATVAPGVQVSRSGTYTQPSIRGVSTIFAGSGQETNVAIYVDGFYTSDQLSSNQDFANIQDIQVLKGPQGTLYGRNATGGAILITTKSPTDKWRSEASISYAPRYSDKIANAFVGGPLANGIKFSIAGNWHESNGYFKDINHFAPNAMIDYHTYLFGGHAPPYTPGQVQKRGGKYPGRFKNWSVRPKLVLEPTDGVKITLGYIHAYIDDPRAFAYGVVAATKNPGPTYQGYPIAYRMRDRTSLNFQPVNQSESDEYNATGEFKLGDAGTITTRTAFRKQKDFQVYDLDGTPNDPSLGTASPPAGAGFYTYDANANNRRKTFTQQIDYNGQFGALNLLAGFFYYDDKFSSTNYADTGGSTSPTASPFRFDTKAWAVYLDGTYNISDKLFITVGGRYANDKKRMMATRYLQDGTYDPTGSTGGWVRMKKNSFTPRGVIRYNLSRGTNVYASISRGFKAGTINGGAPFNLLKPETVTAYEVGYKTARGGFRGEASAFYYNYKNNQISAFNGTTTVTTNSGGAHIYGIDASLSYHFPNAPLNLHAGIEWLHARYTNFPDGENKVIDSGNNLQGVIGPWTGRRMVRAPDWSGTFGADYTFDVGGGKLVLSGTGTFSSRYAPQNATYSCAIVGHDGSGNDIPYVSGQRYCAADTNHHKKGNMEENGYLLVNGQIAWTDPSDHYTITVFANNLTNTRYKIIASGFAYFKYDMYNEPRTVGVKLGVRF